jgi:hypothetical protein
VKQSRENIHEPSRSIHVDCAAVSRTIIIGTHYGSLRGWRLILIAVSILVSIQVSVQVSIQVSIQVGAKHSLEKLGV